MRVPVGRQLADTANRKPGSAEARLADQHIIARFYAGVDPLAELVGGNLFHAIDFTPGTGRSRGTDPLAPVENRENKREFCAPNKQVRQDRTSYDPRA